MSNDEPPGAVPTKVPWGSVEGASALSWLNLNIGTIHCPGVVEQGRDSHFAIYRWEGMDVMYVVVGLGNPGRKYEGTKHNIGFHAIDRLAHRLQISVTKLKHKALIGEGHIGGEKVVLVKPQTFMNLSGQSVMELMQFYKLEPSRLLVIYDDIDVKVGSIRIREKGSAGSHNGMKNIIYLIQRDDFPRIRIGVGKPREGQDLADFVLSPFDREALPLIDEAVDRAVLAVETIIKENLQLAMNKYNG